MATGVYNDTNLYVFLCSQCPHGFESGSHSAINGMEEGMGYQGTEEPAGSIHSALKVIRERWQVQDFAVRPGKSPGATSTILGRALSAPHRGPQNRAHA